MANLFIDKERRVVPNWRSFGKTTVLGELNSHQTTWKEPPLEVGIDDYIIDFQLNRTVIHASDLLSAAVVNNHTHRKEVIDAAEFLMKNDSVLTFSQRTLAQRVLSTRGVIDLNENISKVHIGDVSSIIDVPKIRKRIREIKNVLKQFPYNAVLYVELSRYYSVLGEENFSVKAMKAALHLSQNNRFILRSAARLFAHVSNEDNDYLEYIHSLLRKSELVKNDPWVLSAEISIATVLGRYSRNIKKGISLVKSNNISPFSFTELASSIGTVELLNGSHKKSREFFEISQIKPNDNSLAQLEWASEKDNRIKIISQEDEVKLKYEALALDDYQNGRYESALENAMKWLKDMPYSKRPVMFGSNLASIVLKQYHKSISMLGAGEISHPYDPQIINNLAYAYALNNEPDKAFGELSKLRDAHQDEITESCLLATKGLAYFRKGQPTEGRFFYGKAIDKTHTLKNKNLNWIAILNYAREEILADSEYIPNVIEAVEKVPDAHAGIEIRMLKKDVLDLYHKSKK